MCNSAKNSTFNVLRSLNTGRNTPVEVITAKQTENNKNEAKWNWNSKQRNRINENKWSCSITNSNQTTITSIPAIKTHSWKHTDNIKRRECGLWRELRPTITSNKTSNKVYTKQHANFIRIRKAISRTIQHRSDPNGNVINLSKYLFAKGLNYSLNKNLSFCPSPGQYN